MRTLYPNYRNEVAGIHYAGDEPGRVSVCARAEVCGSGLHTAEV